MNQSISRLSLLLLCLLLLGVRVSASLTPHPDDLTLVLEHPTLEHPTAKDIVSISYARGFEAGKKAVKADPYSYQLYDLNATIPEIVNILYSDLNSTYYKKGYDLGYSEGNQSVYSNPGEYNLLTLEEFDESVIDILNSKTISSMPYTSGWFFVPDRGWLFANQSSFPWFYEPQNKNFMMWDQLEGNASFYHSKARMWVSVDKKEFIFPIGHHKYGHQTMDLESFNMSIVEIIQASGYDVYAEFIEAVMGGEVRKRNSYTMYELLQRNRFSFREVVVEVSAFVFTPAIPDFDRDRGDLHLLEATNDAVVSGILSEKNAISYLADSADSDLATIKAKRDFLIKVSAEVKSERLNAEQAELLLMELSKFDVDQFNRFIGFIDGDQNLSSGTGLEEMPLKMPILTEVMFDFPEFDFPESHAHESGKKAGENEITTNPYKHGLGKLSDVQDIIDKQVESKYSDSIESGQAIGFSDAVERAVLNHDLNFINKDSLSDFNTTQEIKDSPYTNGWFYQTEVGWRWTDKTTYPYIYDQNTGGWLYFISDSENALLFEYDSESWKSVE
jgi:hypothetical protein